MFYYVKPFGKLIVLENVVICTGLGLHNVSSVNHYHYICVTNQLHVIQQNYFA